MTGYIVIITQRIDSAGKYIQVRLNKTSFGFLCGEPIIAKTIFCHALLLPNANAT